MTHLDINDSNYFTKVANALGCEYSLTHTLHNCVILSKGETMIYLWLQPTIDKLTFSVKKWEYLKTVPKYIELNYRYLDFSDLDVKDIKASKSLNALVSDIRKYVGLAQLYYSQLDEEVTAYYQSFVSFNRLLTSLGTPKSEIKSALRLTDSPLTWNSRSLGEIEIVGEMVTFAKLRVSIDRAIKISKLVQGYPLFNGRELATILAGLRAIQFAHSKGEITMPHFDDCTPLTPEEIDNLCLRLNQ